VNYLESLHVSATCFLTRPNSPRSHACSQVCPCCNSRLHDVKTKDENEYAGVKVHRGLKWCAKCNKFFSRDYVGAFNIGRKGCGPYPVAMLRGGCIVWDGPPLSKYIPPPQKSKTKKE